MKADLHVHSSFSSNPDDFLLKKFGARESYTSIDELYRTAKGKGMDLVTVTDHNTIDGALLLVERYPEDTFMGVELTCTFPEDDCAVHVLAYDFSAAQFKEMDRRRRDIYALREYLRDQGIAHAVAHATYSVNGRLTLATVEKLILLFDVFETINGTRALAFNGLLKKVLASLDEARIDELRRRHGIAPMSATPWVKGFTGGSDEHAGLFIGETFTTAQASSREEFLGALRSRRTDSGGRSNHYKTQVYTFLKIAYEYSRTRRKRSRAAVMRAWDEVGGAIFEGRGLSWKAQLKLEQMKRSRKGKNRLIATQVSALARRLVQDPVISHQEKIDLIYETMVGLEDAFLLANIDAMGDSFKKGDVLQIVSHITAMGRSLLLSLPFLATFRHLHHSSALMDEMRAAFLGPLPDGERKTLLFTDTLDGLETGGGMLQATVAQARQRGIPLTVVAARRPEDLEALLIPAVYEYVPEFNPTYALQVPSLLKSLDLIYACQPAEIVVATPGPVGLLGVLSARLFGIRCRGIYHSGFNRMAGLAASGGSMAGFVQGYVRWFYGNLDEIFVADDSARERLIRQRYDASGLKVADGEGGVWGVEATRLDKAD